jgi:thymidylate kinase
MALFKGLQNVPELAHYNFLTDSHGTSTKHCAMNPFIEGVTNLVGEGLHEEANPYSQLFLFWARLAEVVREYVIPCLAQGTPVIIKGFGGSVLANAMARTKSKRMRDSLLNVHKSIVDELIIGAKIPPPKYLWLRTEPDIAQKRLNLDGYDQMEEIALLNHMFSFYGTIHGQTVIPIDADQHPEKVLIEALAHIIPQHELELTV